MIQVHDPVSLQSFLRLGEFTLDVDFACGPGITVLFGPSGAGKTIVLNLIAGTPEPRARTDHARRSSRSAPTQRYIEADVDAQKWVVDLV